MHEFPARNIEIIVPPGHPVSKPVFPPGPKSGGAQAPSTWTRGLPAAGLEALRFRDPPCLAQLLTQLSPATNLPSRAVTLFARRQVSFVSPGHRAQLATFEVDAQHRCEQLAVKVMVALPRVHETLGSSKAHHRNGN